MLDNRNFPSKQCLLPGFLAIPYPSDRRICHRILHAFVSTFRVHSYIYLFRVLRCGNVREWISCGLLLWRLWWLHRWNFLFRMILIPVGIWHVIVLSLYFHCLSILLLLNWLLKFCTFKGLLKYFLIVISHYTWCVNFIHSAKVGVWFLIDWLTIPGHFDFFISVHSTKSCGALNFTNYYLVSKLTMFWSTRQHCYENPRTFHRPHAHSSSIWYSFE